MAEIERLTMGSTHMPGSPRALAECVNECLAVVGGYRALARMGLREEGDEGAVATAWMRIAALGAAARDAGLVDAVGLGRLTDGDPAAARAVTASLWSRGCDCGFCASRPVDLAWADTGVNDPLRLRDALTGVHSYFALSTLAPESHVVLVDLVAFRDRFNYPYGHAIGDRVLREAAARLRDGLRPLRVFRSGGDEFVVEAAPDLDEAGAADLASQISALLAPPLDWLGLPAEQPAGLPPVPESALGRPLEARVGVALTPTGNDWARAKAVAESALDEARRAGVPFATART